MRKKIFIIIGVVLLVFFGRLVVRTLKLSPVLFQLIFNREISLKKADHNINILLLGIGGGIHEGFDLTDTVIFASIDQTRNKATLVSIPRDLWIPDLSAKINTAYHQGEAKRKGGGIVLAKAVVSKVVNQPIDYILRIDFDGFVKAVDLVGGIDAVVDRNFDDYEYPIEGKENDTCGRTQDEVDKLATSSAQLEAFPCRYKHIHFDKGKIHMNGQTALEFVRSRHALGEEGTDFARSKRQEKVINALKNKVLSVETFLIPTKIVSLFDILQKSIDTNIKQDEYDDFIRLAQKMKNSNIKNATLDYGNESINRPGLLINPLISTEFDNQWVLIPRIGNGNYLEIQEYVECEIKVGSCPVPKTPKNLTNNL